MNGIEFLKACHRSEFSPVSKRSDGYGLFGLYFALKQGIDPTRIENPFPNSDDCKAALLELSPKLDGCYAESLVKQILTGQDGKLFEDSQWIKFPYMTEAWRWLVIAISYSHEVSDELESFPDKWDPNAWRVGNEDAKLYLGFCLTSEIATEIMNAINSINDGSVEINQVTLNRDRVGFRFQGITIVGIHQGGNWQEIELVFFHRVGTYFNRDYLDLYPELTSFDPTKNPNWKWDLVNENCSLDDPQESSVVELNRILQFEGGGASPVQYETDFEGAEYYVRYRWGGLGVDKNDCDLWGQSLSNNPYHGEWDDIQTEIYLTHISNAIRNDTWDSLVLAQVEEIESDPLYRKQIYPALTDKHSRSVEPCLGEPAVNWLLCSVVGFWIVVLLVIPIFIQLTKPKESAVEVAKEKAVAMTKSVTDMLSASWDEVNLDTLAPKSPSEIASNLVIESKKDELVVDQAHPIWKLATTDPWYVFCEDLSRNGESLVKNIDQLINAKTWQSDFSEPKTVKPGSLLIENGKITKKQNDLLGSKFATSVSGVKSLVLLEYSSKKIAEYETTRLSGHAPQLTQPKAIGIDAYQCDAELVFLDVATGKQYGYKKFTARDPDEMELRLLSTDRFSKPRASEIVEELVIEYLQDEG